MRTSPLHVRSMVVATIAALSLTLPAAAQNALVSQIRIENFARVDDGYYRGGQPMGSDYADLAKLGVKTIINLIGDSDLDAAEPSVVQKHGMRYVTIPMSTRKAPTTEQLQMFLTIANDPESQPVYVHCVGGRHRTGVMTAVYRMMKDGISGADAFSEMKRFKFGPDFLHPEFKRFVYEFDAKKTAVAVTAGS